MNNILFVCMGNICRSPSAEAVMKSIVEQHRLEEDYFIDSAGTIAYHEGEEADLRMRQHAAMRGYKLDSISRKFNYSDFEKFDYIIVMDRENYDDILELDAEGKYSHKVTMMTDYAENEYKEVPDPYYGGDEGFENVLNILEDAAFGLLMKIQSKNNGKH